MSEVTCTPIESAENKTKNASNISTLLLKWAVTILIPLAIWFSPIPLESNHKLFLALTMWAVVTWVVEILPNEMVAMTLPVLYLVSGLAPANVIYDAFGAIPVWTTPGAMLIGLAIMVTGLGKRIAFWTLLRMKNYTVFSLSVAITIIGVVLMFICPDNLARFAVLAPIAISICQIMDYKPKSKEATVLMLVAFFAGAASGIGILTSASQNIMVNSLYTEAVGHPIKWVEWAAHNFIPSLFWITFSLISAIIIYRPKKNTNQASQNEAIRKKVTEQYQEVGAFNVRELRVLLYVGVIIGVYLLQPILNFTFAPDWVFVLILPLIFLPGVGLLNKEDFDKINLNIMFFIAGAISIGVVAGHIGFSKVLAGSLSPMLQGSPLRIMAIIWFFGVAVNFVLTPLAALATFTDLLVGIAAKLGLSALPLVYTLNYAMDIYILPYEYAILLFAFGYGYMNFRDVFKALCIRSVLGFILLTCICYPYWKLLGLF